MKEFICVLLLSLAFGVYIMVGTKSEREATNQKIQAQVTEIQKRFVDWGVLEKSLDVVILWKGHMGYAVIYRLNLPGMGPFFQIIIDPSGWSTSSLILREVMIAHEMGHIAKNCLDLYNKKAPHVILEHCADIQAVRLVGLDKVVKAMKQHIKLGHMPERIAFLEAHEERIVNVEKYK